MVITPFTIPVVILLWSLVIWWIVDRSAEVSGRFRYLLGTFEVSLATPLTIFVWIFLPSYDPRTLSIRFRNDDAVSIFVVLSVALFTSVVLVSTSSILGLLIQRSLHRLGLDFSKVIGAMFTTTFASSLTSSVLAHIFVPLFYGNSQSITLSLYSPNFEFVLPVVIFVVMVGGFAAALLIGLGSWGTLRWRDSTYLGIVTVAIFAILSPFVGISASLLYSQLDAVSTASQIVLFNITYGYSIVITIIAILGAVTGGLLSEVLRGFSAGIEMVILIALFVIVFLIVGGATRPNVNIPETILWLGVTSSIAIAIFFGFTFVLGGATATSLIATIAIGVFGTVSLMALRSTPRVIFFIALVTLTLLIAGGLDATLGRREFSWFSRTLGFALIGLFFIAVALLLAG